MNERIKALVLKIRSPKILIALGLAGMLLILLSSFASGSKATGGTKREERGIQPEDYRAELEKSVKELVKQITGTRAIHVVITLESGIRYSYAGTSEGTSANKIESDSESASSELKQSYVTVRSADGGEEALLVTEEMPQVRGVAIVCEGGDNEQIQEKITNAVMAALHVTSRRVYVTGGY